MLHVGQPRLFLVGERRPLRVIKRIRARPAEIDRAMGRCAPAVPDRARDTRRSCWRSRCCLRWAELPWPTSSDADGGLRRYCASLCHCRPAFGAPMIAAAFLDVRHQRNLRIAGEAILRLIVLVQRAEPPREGDQVFGTQMRLVRARAGWCGRPTRCGWRGTPRRRAAAPGRRRAARRRCAAKSAAARESCHGELPVPLHGSSVNQEARCSREGFAHR